MKYRLLILTFLSVFTICEAQAQVYVAQEMYVHFFSPAPIADIEAISNSANAKLNTEKKEVEIQINVTSFKFKKALMQTHFNERSIESDKYPLATFKGRFKEEVNLENEGIYTLTMDGHFNIHGVDRSKTVICLIKVKNHKISFETSFKLMSADYKIKTPDIIYRKVGQEVSIDAKGLMVKEKN